jgi:hypothetical protein
MAKYGKKASKKVEKTMRERKRGTLRSGSGKKVTSRKQAVAIGLAQARREGGKVPAKRKTAKKRTAKKKTSSSRTRKKKATSRKKSSGRKQSSTRKRS